MNKIVLMVLCAGLLSVAAGLVFLLTWDIPAPSQTVERELADDNFPR